MLTRTTMAVSKVPAKARWCGDFGSVIVAVVAETMQTSSSVGT
jgi:hypothetical protein